MSRGFILFLFQRQTQTEAQHTGISAWNNRFLSVDRHRRVDSHCYARKG